MTGVIKTDKEMLRELWVRSCFNGGNDKKTGTAVTPPEPAPLPPVEVLAVEEWSIKFEELMHNRMVQGAYRYGRLRESGGDLRRVRSAIKRLEEYLKTGNAELLVDAANLCMCEFEVPGHSGYHFNSVDDGDHHWNAGEHGHVEKRG